jgi:uncharacterized membrane-anchored protein YhcB (DUF1043 family)
MRKTNQKVIKKAIDEVRREMKKHRCDTASLDRLIEQVDGVNREVADFSTKKYLIAALSSLREAHGALMADQPTKVASDLHFALNNLEWAYDCLEQLAA